MCFFWLPLLINQMPFDIIRIFFPPLTAILIPRTLQLKQKEGLVVMTVADCEMIS